MILYKKIDKKNAILFNLHKKKIFKFRIFFKMKLIKIIHIILKKHKISILMNILVKKTKLLKIDLQIIIFILK